MFQSEAVGYRRLSPGQARWVLVFVGVAVSGAVALTLSPLASSNLVVRPKGTSDVSLHRAVVDRIHGGEGYYRATAAELTARGYPTRSVFNWRTPLPIWLLGKLPSPAWGRALLGMLALAAGMMALAAVAREQPRPRLPPQRTERTWAGEHRPDAPPSSPPPLSEPGPSMFFPSACALLLIGAMMPDVLGDLFVMPELWAGTLLLLSLGAYGTDRRRLGILFGLAALFFRELALPYCLLCAALAWRAGQRRELRAWLVGLAAWGLFFGLHWWRVRGLILPDAIAHRHGWLSCGGAAFVISTAQMNAYLLCLPQWVTAVYLVAALVGYAGWDTPLGTRIGLSACLFLSSLALVGQTFNQYWGAMIAPLLCFGVARSPRALAELWRAATSRASYASA